MLEPGTRAETPDWHLRLFKKSILKQAKLHQIVDLLGPVSGQTCLDIGGDNGVISWNLRQLGGTWTSVDMSEKAVESIRRLVGGRVELITGSTLPFADGTFDVVVIIDMLEHLQQDYPFVAECHRVLKPTGRLIFNVPHIKSWAFLPPLRRMLGLTEERHGHIRPGYTEAQMFDLLKDGFDVQEVRTYSRFFVEALDMLIQFAAMRANTNIQADAKGVLIDKQDFIKMDKMFRFYSMLYPFFRLAAQLDKLLFFTKGYCLIGRARRRQWLPRRSPVLADGRSIAEAALGGKIGTAAPF
jgi:ubiquinone/menaquinone biosynthesis C-methylase UbiE